ncbi:MAG: MG2 domain-containing protein [Pseudomonadota bacterium]
MQAFSPRGTVHDVEQVRATFSEPMVRIGDKGAATPFEVVCALDGKGRWIDERNWVWDVLEPEAAEVRRDASHCSFKLGKQLTTLAGIPLQGEREFGFALAAIDEAATLAIADHFPHHFMRVPIGENQVFAIAFNRPTNAAPAMFCTVGGGPREPAVVLGKAQAPALLPEHWDKYDAKTVVFVRCPRQLPAAAQIQLGVDRGKLKPTLLAYTVRPDFAGRISCQTAPPANDCVPGEPIRLIFNAAVPAQALAAVRLRSATGEASGLASADTAHPYVVVRSTLTFAGPHAASSTFSFSYPAGFADADGRLPAAGALPAQVSTSANIPVAIFTGTPFRFARPGASANLLLTHKAAPAAIHELLVGTGDDAVKADRDIMQWLRRFEDAENGYRRFGLNQAQARGAPLEREPAAALRALPAGGAAALSGPAWKPALALSGKGLHLLEMTVAPASMPGKLLTERSAVFITDMAVHLKLGRDSSAVWVTTLDTASPVAGAELRLYDCKGKMLWSGKSGGDGVARIGAPLATPECSREPYLDGITAIARHRDANGNEDVSIARSTWDDATDARSQNVQRSYRPRETYRANTVLDRSLFRPGETVSMRHVIRRESSDGLELLAQAKLPAFAVIEADGTDKQWKLPLVWRGADAVSTFQIPADATLGAYTITLGATDDNGRGGGDDVSEPSGSFTVAAFRQPLMAGQIQAGTAAAPLMFGEPASIGVSLRYANGGAAKGWPVALRITANQGSAPYQSESGYSFAKAAPKGSPDDWSGEDGTLLAASAIELEADGAARLALPPLPVKRDPYRLNVELTYADPSGEQQTISERFMVWPAALRVGIAALGRPRAGRQLLLSVIGTDTEGKRLPGQALQVTARHLPGDGKVGYYRVLEEQASIVQLGVVCDGRSDAAGILPCRYLPTQSGHYEFTATGRDGAGRTTSATRVVNVPVDAVGAEDLFVQSDRGSYEAGQSARLTLDVPFAKANALIAIEREGVMETRVVPVHGPRSEIALQVQPSWSPNVFVTLLALAPAQGAGTMPRLATGALRLKVGNGHRSLRVAVTSDKASYGPRERAKVRIRVTMPDGTPVPAGTTVAFAAVDEALLALQDNTSWQLLANLTLPRFYLGTSHSPLTLPAPPPLDTQERQAIGRMIEAMGGGQRAMVDELQGPIGLRRARGYEDGSGSASLRVEVTGSRIDPSATASPELAAAPKNQGPALRAMLDNLLMWRPALALDKNGRAEIALPLNDALTRFRLVAVASVGSNYFGDGSANIDVTQDVQLSSGLPPVAREGDHFDAMVTVRNAGKRALTLAVSAKADGVPALVPRTVKLGPGEAQLVRWRVRVPGAIKKLSWRLDAIETGAGKQTNGDRLAVEQVIEPAVPPTVQAASLRQLDAELAIPIALPGDAVAGSGAVSVSLQASLGGGLPGVREWFERYPYRCLEQRAARAFGMQDKAAWAALMAELPTYLDQDGLASYFPLAPDNRDGGSDTLTAHLLALSHETGWEIPPDARQNMLNGLSGFATSTVKRSNWAPRDDGSARKLAALAALARHQRASAAMVKGIRIDADEWTVAMLIDWIGVLRRVPNIPDAAALQAQAENHLRARLSFSGTRMVFSTEKRDAWSWLMNNGDVDAARLLLTVRELPAWRADMPRIASGLLARQERGAWSSTVANVWGMLAVERFSGQFEAGAVTGRTDIALGAGRKTVAWSANRAAPVTLPLAPGESMLRLVQTGSGKPWATVQVVGAVPLAAPQHAGYRIEKSMTAVRQKVAGRVSVGDIWRIKLAVDAQADMAWVVLDDAVPAGASILGTGLGRDAASATQGEQRTGNVWPAYEERGFTRYRSYYNYVPRGRFSQEYTIRINNAGTFVMPPTRVEAMYAPDVFGAVPNAPLEIDE